MSTLADLTPGCIGFGPLGGLGNPLVGIGQAILGEGFTVGKLNIGHVFVVTDTATESNLVAQQIADAYDVPLDIVDPHGPRIVEAMPNGAREVIVGPERWTPEYAYARLPQDYPGQAADAAAIARAMIGTPYSFASYAALAAWRFGMKTPRLEKWINRRKPGGITVDGGTIHDGLPCEAICSVLADQAWALTGKQVMPVGTPHQCVTPGALAGHLLNGMPGVEWLWPE